ncbi:unnamed protein product [Prorocentrum cordatum]|uniref:Calmodulin n=1 Tax=Prorocentrum cordatum TaxID=2364126 RepID=A0ABN9U032_9DINO|nr:unnamed protein product [Polarella glacialis]
MAKAFDMLNPCLFLEEFQEALQALGFAPGADFKRLFNLLDVSRTGRISKADFVSLLERHVKDDVHTLSYRADNVEQDVAARRIQRYVRYHQLRYELPDSDSPMESNFAKLAETQLDVFRREAGLKKESVPTTVFSKLVDDHQRVINRVLVLENEIDYLRRQVEFGAVGSRVVNSEEVRKLQSANRNLLHHFYCAQSAAAAGAAAPEPERHEPEAPAATAEGQEEEAAELKREKRHLQLELGKGVVRLQRELEALAERTRASQEEPAAAPHALSAAQLAGGRSSSRRTALSVGFAAEGKPAEFRLSADARGGSRTTWEAIRAQPEALPLRSPSRQGWEVQLDFQTQSHRVLKEALSAFAADRDVTKFLREVSGSSVVGRYVVRDVISVETDMIRLRCSDSYLQRHVCICLPISDTVDMRRVFMRRFCILAVLADVCEVQSVFHFPGFSEYLAFCVMELLQGAPLSSRLRACRGGACAPIPAHDAAQICDALLTGLEECHKRGITHLDLKPSAVWEMQQPSATVVKILDFGRAQVADAEALAPGAQAFFEVQLPAEGAEIAAWEAFAPFALLIGVGSPWYMSPARWCDFTLKHQKTDVTQPALRLWKEPGQFDQTPWVRSGEDEGDMDIITAREATESGLAFQATRPAPTFPDGAYFEVVLLKVWPPQQLSGCVDRHDGPVGFAVGFTRTPPHLNDARRCRARKQPNSWVVGYDGRFFENGQEVPTQDEASEDGREQMRDRRRLSAAQAAQPDVLGGTRSAQAHSQMAWPIGPMGFSLAELQRNDRLGVMATESGHLVLFVNDAMICKVKATNLSAREPLYPLVEICGVAREIGLVPRPRGPRGLEESHRAHDHMASTCERLAPHAETTYADIYAAAAIVQECFCSTARPTVPSAFLQLLSAVSSWIQQGCPEVALHGDMLLALTRWSKTSRVQSGLDPGIADVLQRVFSAAGAPPNVLGAAGTICSARQLRMALNEKTGCRHVSPEFLGSHAKAVTQATNLRRFLHQGLRERDSAPQRLDAELWDIRPWTLSASHIRHVVLVLQSELEGHIWRVGISKLEANVPLELKLQLVKCFNRTLQTVNGDGDEPAPSSGSSRSTRRRPGIVGFHAVPSLQFESFPLPADACPVSFARLQEANAVGVVLHFVRRVSLGQGLSETPVGTAGAAQLAEALHGNVLLQELEAPGQGFGDEGAALLSDALQGGTRLRHLRLGGNGIGDAGAQALAAALRAPACELQLLDLAGNALGDSGCTVLAEAVQKNAHLCSLVLRRNGIGPDGATALADALMYNHALTELDLGQNSVDAAGAGALARATRVNVSLASLSLQGNSLDMRAAVCLAEALAGEPCEFPPNIDKPRFATRAAGARPEGARASWSPRNSAATLAANMLNDARSRANQGSCLQRLDLRRNSLGSTGAATLLEALRGSTRLTSISLAWNELGLEASAAVAELFRPGSQCALRELDLRDNRLGEFSALGRALEGMARHILERSGDGANSSKGSARSSSKRPSARGGSKEAPSQSRKSTQEEVLPRRGTLAPPGPDAIVVQELGPRVFKNLEVLLMYNNPGLASRPGQDSAGAPEVAGLSALVRGLPPTLRHLSLGSCGIGSVGVVSVLRALKHGKSLELLDLSDNDCHESSDKDEQLFCDALIGAIVNLPSLRRLNLALNRIADDSVIRLAQVLCFEAPGVTVDVSVNKVSDDLIQAVRDWVANEAAGATAQDSGTDPDPSEVMPTTPSCLSWPCNCSYNYLGLCFKVFSRSVYDAPFSRASSLFPTESPETWTPRSARLRSARRALDAAVGSAGPLAPRPRTPGGFGARRVAALAAEAGARAQQGRRLAARRPREPVPRGARCASRAAGGGRRRRQGSLLRGFEHALRGLQVLELPAARCHSCQWRDPPIPPGSDPGSDPDQIRDQVILSLIPQIRDQIQANGPVARRSSLRGELSAASFRDEVRKATAEAFGCGGQIDQSRLARVEEALLPIWRASPKDDAGRVENRTLRYMAHRYFKKRSSMWIRGLEQAGPASSEWRAADVLSRQVPGHVESVLASRHAAEHGFDLHDAALMVAALERMVFLATRTPIFDAESHLLEDVYQRHRRTTDEGISRSALKEFLLRWILAENVGGSAGRPLNRDAAARSFPQWFEVAAMASGEIHFGDAHEVVGGIVDRFGSFWQAECTSMRDQLVAMDVHRTGRVPLAKFYGTGQDANWRFAESEAYLRDLGALDESSPWRGKQVIIANYIQAASNCIVSTPHYLVCCASDCEPLLAEVEAGIGRPVGTPEEILRLVGNMTSQVPIHGRLFAQWLHYAFPRECPFPHKAGAASARTPAEFGDGYLVTSREVQQHADVQGPVDKEDLEWMSQWSSEEELIADYKVHLSAPWERRLPAAAVLAAAAAALAAFGGVASGPGKARAVLPCYQKAHFV